MKKAKFLERRTSKIKFAAVISRKNIIKSIFFVKKKQDFLAAKTPHSKVEVNLFLKILHHWITYLKKKKSKTHKLTNHIHSFLEQFYTNTMLIFAQNLRTN